MLKLVAKSFLIIVIITAIYSAFMFMVDPYVLVKTEYTEKQLPYNPMYNYNFIKHYDNIDYGFLGSSAVNYFPIEYLYPGNVKCYSMGIESSNINEHIAYGKVLASKQPKEIVFFITFYALNPARGPQNYFHPFVIDQNNIMIDFIDQYFNKGAYDDAIKYLKDIDNKENIWEQEFNANGTRTQNFYLKDKNYDSEKVFADYLSYMYVDPKYYASKTFEDPSSIKKGIEAIKQFCEYLRSKGIKIKLATAPEHRLNMALVYYSGLGKTYEEFRRQLASIQPFYDLNADTAYTSKTENFWDTHHVRNGYRVMNDLKSDTFLVNAQNVDELLECIRPTKAEMNRLVKILGEYKNWDKIMLDLKKELALTPQIAP